MNRISLPLSSLLLFPLVACSTPGSYSRNSSPYPSTGAEFELAASDGGVAPQATVDEKPFYIKTLLGLTLLEDDELIYQDGLGGSQLGDAEFDPGFLGGLAFGWRLDPRWTLEAEYTYRTNDVDSFESSGSTLADGGDFASASAMLNLLYHWDPESEVDPYLGVGFGTATEIDIDLEGPSFPSGSSFSGNSPAAQFMVGVQRDWTDYLRWNLEARYYRAFDPEMNGEGNPGIVETEYGQFSLLGGVSYSF